MEVDLEKFLNKIAFKNKEALQDVKITKILLINSQKLIEVYLSSPKVIPYDVVLELFACCQKASTNIAGYRVVFHYEQITEEDVINYVKSSLEKLIIKKPSLSGILEMPIKIDEEVITIEVGSIQEEQEMLKETKKIGQDLIKMGLGEYEFAIVFNEEIRKSVQKEINVQKESVNIEIKEPEIEGNLILGHEINSEISVINNVVGEAKSIAFEAYIFGIEGLERENINILNLKISDKTNSLGVKVFVKDPKEYQMVKKRLKIGG